VELEKDGWDYVDMLWCQGAQNIGLNVHFSYDHNACPSKTDRQTVGQTDRRTNITAMA